MKTPFLPMLSPILLISPLPAGKEVGNPQIDYGRFATLTSGLAEVCERHQVGEAEFLRLAAEPGTVVLDARSRDELGPLLDVSTTRFPFAGSSVER